MRARRAAGALVAVVLVVVGLSACQPARPRVIVYGDSLAWESAREIQDWAAARGYEAVLHTRFGGAPCSLYDTMRQDRATRPAVVILTFSGNTDYLAPCVGKGDYPASYRAQMREVKRIWTGSGVRIEWVAVPRVPVWPSEETQDAMRTEAEALGMGTSDGGRYVSPGRTWAWTQPCMSGERCTGHQLNPSVPAGRNIVRANDRVHFCPGAGHGLDPCSAYSSGSWRFARALTEVLLPRTDDIRR